MDGTYSGFLASYISIRQPSAIWRPRRSALIIRSCRRFPRFPAPRRNKKDSVRLFRESRHECNPVPVRRPARKLDDRRGKVDLAPLTAIRTTDPEGMTQVVDINDPLPVACKVDICRCNSRKKGREVLRRRVKPKQFIATGGVVESKQSMRVSIQSKCRNVTELVAKCDGS